jgi:hypothetical protein
VPPVSGFFRSPAGPPSASALPGSLQRPSRLFSVPEGREKSPKKDARHRGHFRWPSVPPPGLKGRLKGRVGAAVLCLLSGGAGAPDGGRLGPTIKKPSSQETVIGVCLASQTSPSTSGGVAVLLCVCLRTPGVTRECFGAPVLAPAAWWRRGRWGV